MGDVVYVNALQWFICLSSSFTSLLDLSSFPFNLFSITCCSSYSPHSFFQLFVSGLTRFWEDTMLLTCTSVVARNYFWPIGDVIMDGSLPVFLARSPIKTAHQWPCGRPVLPAYVSGIRWKQGEHCTPDTHTYTDKCTYTSLNVNTWMCFSRNFV